MTPTYFPFTYIPDYIAKAVYTYFNTFILYMPSKLHIPESINNLAHNNIMDLHFPVKGDENLISSIIKDLNNWGDLFLDNGSDLLKTQLNTIPFFDKSSSSQLISEIKKGTDHKTNNKQNMLLNARIFLYFAQNLDQKNYELNNNFSLLEKQQQILFYNLTKNDTHVFKEKTKKTIQADNFYDYMIIERLKAWTYLALNNIQTSSFFLTHSRRLIDFLKNNFNEIKKNICIDLTSIEIKHNKTGKNNKSQILTYIESIAKNIRTPEIVKSQDNINKSFKLTLYVVPDTIPYDFFCKVINYKNNIKNTQLNKNQYKNTVIGLIEFNF